MTEALLGEFDEARHAVESALSEWVTTIDRVLLDALSGDQVAARTYATAFVGMGEAMCRLVVRDAEVGAWLLRVVRREAVAAPFRACSVQDRPGLGVAMTVLGDARRMLAGVPDLQWPSEACTPLVAVLELEDRHVASFERVVDRVVDSSVSPLEEVVQTFDLSHTDAGRLFGVSRQVIAQWLAQGVAADRQASVVSVAQTATLLRHYLAPERIPGIARKPAERYGGRSMLDMIADGDYERLRELTRDSFDWAATA